MIDTRRTAMGLVGTILTLALLGLSAALTTASETGFTTGNGYFEPPTVSDTEIVGPMYVFTDQHVNHQVNVHGPEISFGQDKGTGAPTVQLPAVQTPAGILPAVDPGPPAIEPTGS